MNVTTQDDQLAAFANAAAHLEPGGCFVIEALVPQRRPGPSQAARVFTLDPDHIGSRPWRYVWPSELDLMTKGHRTS